MRSGESSVVNDRRRTSPRKVGRRTVVRALLAWAGFTFIVTSDRRWLHAAFAGSLSDAGWPAKLHASKKRRRRRRHGSGVGNSGIARVTLTVRNASSGTLDLRLWKACGDTWSGGPLLPGEARSVTSKAPFAAAWVNQEFANIIDRGNDIQFAQGGSFTRQRCYQPGEIVREINGVPVGQVIGQRMGAFLFELVRDENDRATGNRAIYTLSVRDSL